MLGHFAACPANAACVRICSTPFSRGRGIVQCSPSLCTVRFSFSPASGRLSTLTPHPSYRTPPSSPFFLLLVTHPPSRGPRRVDLPLFSPLFFPYRSHRKRTVSPTLSPQHAPSVYPIPAASTSGVLRPNSVCLYKIPLVLALLLHPHSSHIHSRATKSSCRCEARFGSLRS